MRCVICRSSFERLSRGGPHEPCDCGAELTLTALADMDPADVERLRREWNNGQEKPEPARQVAER